MAHKSMASSLLKGLALTVGGGVALGVGIKIGQGGSLRESLDVGPADEGSAGNALDPVLDRLHGIENRIGQVESALAESAGSVPSFEKVGQNAGQSAGDEPFHHALGQFESRLTSQDSEMATLRNDLRTIDERHSGSLAQFGTAVDQLQSRLPGLVEETVGTCFERMEKKLQREIEETHTRTLDTFVDNIQTKVVQRITSFERDLGGQAEAMTQLREYSLKTDQNMQRLLVGVDRLASEIARKADPKPPGPKSPELPDTERQTAEPVFAISHDFPEPHLPERDPVAQREPDVPASPSSEAPEFIPNSFLDQPGEEKPRAKWLVPTILTGAAATIALLGWQSGIMSSPQPSPPSHTAPQSVPNQSVPDRNESKSAAPSETAPGATAAVASEASRIDSARSFLQHREYAKAEVIYRSILKTDPRNREVVLALADVLYRQNKFEESAGVLKALSAQPRD